MAASTVNDLLLAIDEYMQSNGKGTAYLAGKVAEIFDGADSVLNMKEGPLVKFGTKIKEMTEKVTKVDTQFDMMVDNLKSLNKRTNTLFKKIEKSYKFFDGLQPKAVKFGAKSAGTVDTSKMASKADTFNMIFKSLKSIDNAQNDERFIKMTNAIVLGGIRNTRDIVTAIAATTKESVLQAPPRNENGEQMQLMSESLKSMENRLDTFNKDFQKSRDNLTDKNKSKGWFSWIPTWLKAILLTGGALYGAGKLKGWLDSSELGKTVKTKFNNMTTNLFNVINKFLGSDFGDLFGTGMKTGVEKSLKGSKGVGGTIETGFDFIWSGITRFFKAIGELYDKNRANIREQLGTLLLGVWDNVVSPLVGIVGKMIYDGVIGWFGKVYDDLLNGKFESAAFTAGLLLAITPGLTTLVKNVIGMGVSGGGVIGFLSKVLIAEIMVAMALMDKNVRDHFKQAEEDTKLGEKFNGNIKIIDDQLKALADTLCAEGRLSPENAALREKLKKKRLQEQMNLIDQGTNASLQKVIADEGIAGQLSTFFGESVNSVARSMFKGTEFRVNTLEQIAEDARNSQLSYKAPVRAVNDAIIVEPHSKDQLLMTKSGGPIDMVFKDMVNQLELLIEVTAAGLGAVAKVSAEGANGVIQAVGATAASSSSSGGTSNGGANSAIRDYRENAKRIIGR